MRTKSQTSHCALGISITGHINMLNIDFFRKAHRPAHYKASLNKMRNGDTLSLGSIVARYPSNIEEQSFKAYAQAYIRKERHGIYSFTGLWTIPTKSSRADIWTSGRFTIDKGIIKLEKTNQDSLEAFFLVCRYINRLIAAERESLINNYHETWYYKNDIPLYFNGFIFDKENISLKVVSRLNQEIDKRIFFKTSFTDDFIETAICTPPLKAIFEKGSALGALDMR
ncbi:hypothetical protein [Shewanella oncorhynchi]|uniref:hypothetical protein n=1 Tax=Shewanella oncorhynchi TaxID=2726434 RepID=UPI003D793DA8